MRGLLITWLMMLIPGWAGDVLEWDRLPDLPDKEGFAGVFAGVVSEGGEDFLVVAGGANFPEGRPWENGKKVYYDEVFVLPLKDVGCSTTCGSGDGMRNMAEFSISRMSATNRCRSIGMI